MVAASLIGWILTLNEGTTVRNWFVRSTSPWLTKSSARITSTGTADAVTDRGSARLPTTTHLFLESDLHLHVEGGPWRRPRPPRPARAR